MNALKFGVAGVLITANLSCSPAAPRQTIIPHFPEEKVVEDNVQSYEPKVDILFVIDNSGSMSGHQANLAANIPLFTSALGRYSFLDFNIGVVTSDGKDKGRLFGANRVVNRNTPNYDAILSYNMRVGTNGDYIERMFDPVDMALSDENLQNWNKDFYRQGAAIAVVFITDAEDQSTITGDQLYTKLLQLKGNDPKMVLAYGVIVPSSSTTNCPRDETYSLPARIEQFLSMVDNGSGNKNIMHLCSPDFGAKLADVSKDIAARVGKIIYLNRLPDVSSIRVVYGTYEIPRDAEAGWSFNPELNAVILGDKLDLSGQPHGAELKVLFNAALPPK